MIAVKMSTGIEVVGARFRGADDGGRDLRGWCGLSGLEAWRGLRDIRG